MKKQIQIITTKKTRIMKNTILTIALTICFGMMNVLNAGNPHVKYDSTSCLLLEGKVFNACDGEDGECKIELFQDGKKIDSLMLKENKKMFRFVLKKNSYYGVVISKKGYISRLVSVNTKISSESELIHKFSFNTTLPSELESEYFNTDALDFPVAVIQYDEQDDSFRHSDEYTNNIKREMRTVYRDIVVSADKKKGSTR